MRGKQKYLWGALSALCTIIIILDSKTALSGAVSGIELCIKTVIPALFPFIFLTGIITGTFSEPLGKFFRPIGKLFKIPEGAETALILGFLGGYPIGAQAVENLYHAGNLQKSTAQRMLSFCNNPGPSFIFGMVGCMFHSLIIPWLIWCIILFGSLLTALLQPSVVQSGFHTSMIQKTFSIETSIKAIAKICGWVVIFRIFIAVLSRWIFWILPADAAIVISGLLELTNGCALLMQFQNALFRFCCATALLSLGGICVAMQTADVAGNLMTKQYFLGKCFQTALSIPLSYIIALFIFSKPASTKGLVISGISLCFAILTGCLLYKNSTGNSQQDSI